MNNSFKTALLSACLILGLTSCYGPRINNKHQVEILNEPFMVAASDQNIEVQFKNLIVKNDQNSWAKDAKWDEYLFNVRNISGGKIIVENITLIDSLDHHTTPEHSRRALNKQTKKNIKRYKKENIKIKLGHGTKNKLFIANTAGTAVTAGLAAGTTVSFSAGAGAGSAATAMGTSAGAVGAAVVILPAVAVGGIMKIINNTKVNNQILNRQTKTPVVIFANQNQNLDMFFPATPSPKAIEIQYSVGQDSGKLIIKTEEILAGLHFKDTHAEKERLMVAN